MYKKYNKNIPINNMLIEENIKQIEQSNKWILYYYLNQIDITDDDYDTFY